MSSIKNSNIPLTILLLPLDLLIPSPSYSVIPRAPTFYFSLHSEMVVEEATYVFDAIVTHILSLEQ